MNRDSQSSGGSAPVEQKRGREVEAIIIDQYEGTDGKRRKADSHSAPSIEVLAEVGLGQPCQGQ